MSITTESGTTVEIVRTVGGDDLVVLHNQDAPEDLRHTESGRVIDGGYQPAMFAPGALTPAVLRAIADLIEGN